MAKRGASSALASASASASSSASATHAGGGYRLRALPAELFGRMLEFTSYREDQLNGLGLVSKGLREATFGGMCRAVFYVSRGSTRVQDAVRLFPNVKELVLQVGSEREGERQRRKQETKKAAQKEDPPPCLCLRGLAGFKNLQKLVLVITGKFAFKEDETEQAPSSMELPHLQVLEVVCPDRRTTGCASVLGQVRLPKLRELDLLGMQDSTSISFVTRFPGLEALGVRMDQEDFEALVDRMEQLNDGTFKALRRLTVVIRKLTHHRGLVERLARGGLDSPLFKLKDIECQIASNHRAKNSPEALESWAVTERDLKDMTEDKWHGILARRQAALLVEGFGPGDERVTHALLDLLDEPGRTLPTITLLDALETVLLEAPTPALVGVAARAGLVAEQALAALRAAAADSEKGEPIPVLARLSSLCSLRRRGRRAWPVGERPFPSAFASAALRNGALATLLSLLHHKDAEARDVGARVLVLLRALPIEAFVKHLRELEDPEERARAMAGVTLPLLLRLADAALLRHRAGDMRRLWNMGVLAQVLAMAEHSHVRSVWEARRRGIVFTMLQCLSSGFQQEWNICSQDGRLEHPVFALFNSLAKPIKGLQLQVRDAVMEGNICVGEAGRDESSQLMRNPTVLLARLVVFLLHGANLSQVLPAGTFRAWTAEMREPEPFSLANFDIAMAARGIMERGDTAAKAMLRTALSEHDLLSLLLTVSYGDEDAGRVWTLLGELYEGDSRLDNVLRAMLDYAKSGDAADGAVAPSSAPYPEAQPPRQIVARALLLFIRDLPRRALHDLLSHVTGRHGSEEADKQRKDDDGRQLETPGFALIRDVVVPLAVVRAPQYWVCHAVLAALEDCISTRNVDVSAALSRALRQQCGRQLVAAAVLMASTPAARDGGVALLRTLYGKEDESIRAALDNEVIKPLEVRGGLERGIRMVRRELGLPVGDSGGMKARLRLPSEDEWDDIVADLMMDESEGESDGYGEEGVDGDGNEGGSEGGHSDLLAPSVAFQAAQEAEEDGAMHVVEEIFEEDLGSDGDEQEDEGEEGQAQEEEFGSESDQSEGGQSDDEAGSLGGSEPSLAWDDVFSGDDGSDGEYMLGEDEEEEEFDEAPNDGSYPEGMFFRGPGGDEEDVDGGGGRGCVDVQPTEMELWS